VNLARRGQKLRRRRRERAKLRIIGLLRSAHV